MDQRKYQKHLREAEGIEIFHTEYTDLDGQQVTQEKFRKVGPIIPRSEVFIKLDATALKGTIGRVVEFDADIWEDDEHGAIISPWGSVGSVVYQVDGRDTTNRVQFYHCDILENYNGQTVLCRAPKKKKAPEPPCHVNKYNQRVTKGSWIVGQQPGRKIAFGKVTRWSHASIWVTVDLESKKPKEICISYPFETFVLPNANDDEMFEQHIMLTVLQGWDGTQK